MASSSFVKFIFSLSSSSSSSSSSSLSSSSSFLSMTIRFEFVKFLEALTTFASLVMSFHFGWN